MTEIDPGTGDQVDMSMNTQGHNHGGKSHLIGMLGIGAVVLVVLLVAGRSFGEAVPLAALLACPLMMIGMMFMMRGGNGHQHGQDSNDRRDHHAPAEPSDSVGSTRPRPQDFTNLN